MSRPIRGIAAAAACVLMLACDAMTPAPLQPSALGGTTARQAGGTEAASAGAVSGASEPVVVLADLPALVQVGSSQLIRTPQGVNFRLSTSGLTPGHAYTVWIVIFNNPAGCAVPHACGPDDVVNMAAEPDMMYAAGRIASGTGTATFAGRRSVGDRSGSVNARVGLPAFGLTDPYGAEIHLAVHDHGPRLPEFLPDMIQTVDGGCTDAGIPVAGVSSPWNDHAFGRRGPNTCVTIQAAVHRP